MATSGWWPAAAASEAGASPTAATTWWPRSARISIRPALITAESSAMTMRRPPGFSGTGRQLDGDGGGAAGRAVDHDAAVDGAGPLGQPAQPAAGGGTGAAVPVVAHPDAEQAGDVHGLEGSVAGAARAGPVGEAL